MQKIVLVICMLLSLNVARAAEFNVDELWDKTNHLYTTGDFKGAIVGYDSIVKSGYAGSKLYYNLANAYYKDNQIGKAILNYNKAQRLAPSDGDIEHNLKLAGGFVKDRINVVPEFFVKTWIRSFMKMAGSNTWALLSLLFLSLTLSLVAMYLLSSRMSLRKGGFYGGIFFMLLLIVSLVFSSIERAQIKNPVEAIVMQSSAPIKSSPDNGSKDIFVLHEGTKVRVVSLLGEWREVVIADGNKGWVLSSAIEMID